jgi:serine/threonine-protein kinase
MKPIYCSKGHENIAGSHFCSQCGEKLPDNQAKGIYDGLILGERYQIIRLLGQGGFGKTYLAEDINRFRELCVLKEFAPQVQGTYALQKGQELFQREAGVLYKVQHPQIPRFRELFRANVDEEGRLFLVQDYVEGQSYRTLLITRKVQHRLFNEPEITQLILQLLPVLEYLHAQGVIHRDISPDNVMLRNADLMPVLIDFGGVKQVAATIESQYTGVTPLATRLGKVGYAPDEQMQMGTAYPHSDLYALAVTMLVLLTGKEPQELRDPQTLTWHWQRYVTLSPTLTHVLEKMLAHRSADRYQSATQVLQALSNSTPTVTYSPLPSPAPLPPPPPSTEATQAISPAYPQPTPIPTPVPVSPTPPTPKPRRFSWLRNLLLILLIIIGMGSVGIWAGHYWVDNVLNNDQPDTAPEDSSNYSVEERERKKALQERREALKIDNSLYINLVNEAFWQQYPQQRERLLTDSPADAIWRQYWDEQASQLLDQLSKLSEPARQKLGQYDESDIQQWKADINKLHVSGRALNDLADAKFYSLFPEQPKVESLINLPIGQVWQAIATEQVQALQNKTALQELRFNAGNNQTEVADVLQPGAGKVYIAYLTKDQTLQVDLQAPIGIVLSIYPPTRDVPPLLEDSDNLQWSGKLPQTGYYEFTVISTASDAIPYSLYLSTTN